MYFDKVALNDEVYGIIYGVGKVRYIVDEEHRMRGFYTFEVEYQTGQRIYYTDSGTPNWCVSTHGCQTVWYKNEIELVDMDISASEGGLTKKKILKLKMKDKLQMKMPSGIWMPANTIPEKEFLKAVSDEKFHLFRKAE